jgi:hypothetical protein
MIAPKRRWLVALPALALAACAVSNGPSHPLPADSTTSAIPAPVITAVPVVTAAPVVATAPSVTAPVVTTAPATVVANGIAGGTTAVVVPARLSAAEAHALLAGNTASGVGANGVAYYTYFAPDNRTVFSQGAYHDTGTWGITTDGRLCSRLYHVNQGAEECYSLYRNVNNTIGFQRPDGNQIGSFTVLAGDPQNL